MKENKPQETLRRLLSVVLVALGLTVTWAWGQVARLAEPQEVSPEPAAVPLYAAWPEQDGGPAVLRRSLDGGQSWQALELPAGAVPAAWASDGRQALAVSLDSGALLLSADRGASWQEATWNTPLTTLAWDESGNLYLGTEQGLHRLDAAGTVTALETLSAGPVVALDHAAGRLFAATPAALYYSDDAGASWSEPAPVEGWITTLAAVEPEVVYAGTATVGVLLSTDAGQTWQPAREGLGLAAGQMVRVTALQADPREPGVLYATVDHAVGGNEVHRSAAGAFVSLDGGSTWQPLSGPAFPEADSASDLVVLPGRPLAVQAVTSEGLQAYEPDVAGALAALESGDAAQRAQAARLLGMARATEAADALLAALSDLDPAVSLMAGEALARIDDPRTASGLLVALEHPDERIRLVAAQSLGQMQVEAAVKPLRTMLFQGTSTEAATAAQALGHIGSPAAIDGLLAGLEEPADTPRWHAAMAGLEAAGERATGPLQDLLDSRDVYVRRNAAEALGWIGAASATPALIDALEDRDEAVRARAAWSLGIIGDPAAQEALQRASQQDPAAAVRDEAGHALTLLDRSPRVARSWTVDWAPVLSRLEPVRWLLLVLSLAAAAWLMVGVRPPAPVILRQRTRER